MADKPEPPPKVMNLDPRDYLDVLYRLFRRDLQRYLFRRVGDPEAIKDIGQDTWRRVARSTWFRTRSEPYCRNGQWVDPADANNRRSIWMTIARHARYALRDYFQSIQIELGGETIKVEHTSLEDWMQGGGDCAQEAELSEEQMIAEAVDLMRRNGFSPREISAYVLHVWIGRTCREIATDLGIGKSTVDRILHKIEDFFEDLQDDSDD